MIAILNAAISRKRRNDGEPLGNILAALLVWPLLKVSSIPNPVLKPRDKDFRDKRSAAAQDMRRARDEDKNTMLRRMLRAGKKGRTPGQIRSG